MSPASLATTTTGATSEMPVSELPGNFFVFPLSASPSAQKTTMDGPMPSYTPYFDKPSDQLSLRASADPSFLGTGTQPANTVFLNISSVIERWEEAAARDEEDLSASLPAVQDHAFSAASLTLGSRVPASATRNHPPHGEATYWPGATYHWDPKINEQSDWLLVWPSIVAVAKSCGSVYLPQRQRVMLDLIFIVPLSDTPGPLRLIRMQKDTRQSPPFTYQTAWRACARGVRAVGEHPRRNLHTGMQSMLDELADRRRIDELGQVGYITAANLLERKVVEDVMAEVARHFE